ncbi:hypothetical protein RAE13_08940 [Corynebacterium curieae]|uniref:DNA helicase DnaB-like N-terminal domain-containing protein n=1 Tax=Corynebacterium curieae TaxID=2913500 RepID=A0ABU3WAH4_9CORY|nr:hypothetical protein [Corynebacterium curieae]MDV2424531.1 hypothetical protein [Corynebacterium curieae]
MSGLETTLSREVLASVIAAPAAQADVAMSRLQASDFPNWIHQRIFQALDAVEFANHQEPGSVITQLHAVLLEAGELKDTDNGLRAELNALLETRGHPEQLPRFVSQVVDEAYRREVKDYGERLVANADSSPLVELDAALKGIDHIRAIRMRIRPMNAVNAA